MTLHATEPQLEQVRKAPLNTLKLRGAHAEVKYVGGLGKADSPTPSQDHQSEGDRSAEEEEEQEESRAAAVALDPEEARRSYLIREFVRSLVP